MESKEKLICDLTKVPHLACLVDPSYRYYYLIKSPYIWMSCDDRISGLLLNEAGFTRHFFMPHAVEPELTEDLSQNRVFDVVLLSSFINYEGRRHQWKKQLPLILCKALDHAIEMTFADRGISFIDAFNRALGEVHQQYPPDYFKKVSFIHLLSELELYVKGRDKAQLIFAIRDIPVHIFGNTIDKLTWKQFLAKKKTSVHVHGSIPYERALDVMKKCKILLNPGLKNCDGSHERVFSGIACGALVLTHPSSYLDERFKEGESILYYRHTLPEKTNELVHHYLSHPEERLALVAKGREKVLAHETWDNRASDLIQRFPLMLAKKDV